MKFKQSDFHPGDIITFDYIDPKYMNIKCEFLTFFTHKTWSPNLIRIKAKLLEEISYTSTHHCGEVFKIGYLTDWLDIYCIKTINGKTPKQLRNFNIKTKLQKIWQQLKGFLKNNRIN